MNQPKQRRPGDLILDRYMPNATEEERDEARNNLKNYAAAIIAIHQRLDRKVGDKAIRVNAMEDVDSNSQS